MTDTDPPLDSVNVPAVGILDVLYPHPSGRPGAWQRQRHSALVELDDGVVVRLDEVSGRLQRTFRPGPGGAGEGS